MNTVTVLGKTFALASLPAYLAKQIRIRIGRFGNANLDQVAPVFERRYVLDQAGRFATPS